MSFNRNFAGNILPMTKFIAVGGFLVDITKVIESYIKYT